MRKDVEQFIKKLTPKEVCLLNKSELARRFNCDPRTIDRHIKLNNGDIEPLTRKKSPSKLDNFKAIIIDKVDTYGCTAMGVYKLIKKRGYKGKYSLVADFVSKHKQNESKKATIRYETNPGLQAQVDWKENITIISKEGEIFKVNIFLMVLGYSRLKYVELTSDRSQNTLFNCLINAFNYFGGIPKEILFDNMKTVVDHSKTTFSQTVFNEKFSYFSKDAGFKAIACRPYRPQTKGKVESLAKLTDRLKAYNEEFSNWEELKKIVKEFMIDINNEKSQATEEVPTDRFINEKEHLLPLPDMNILYSYVFHQENSYKVTKESIIRYKGKKYSVPTKYIGERVTVKEDDIGNLKIYYNKNFVISHQLSSKMYNYTIDTAYEILKSDAMKDKSDDEILKFVYKNLLDMDKKLGGD